MVIEEADESGFWLDFLVQLETVRRPAVDALIKESSELVAIFTKAKMSVEARIEKAREAKRIARAAKVQRSKVDGRRKEEE